MIGRLMNAWLDWDLGPLNSWVVFQVWQGLISPHGPLPSLACNGVWVVGTSTPVSPEEHLTATRWWMLFTSRVSGFNVPAERCTLQAGWNKLSASFWGWEGCVCSAVTANLAIDKRCCQTKDKKETIQHTECTYVRPVKCDMQFQN